VEVEVIQSTMFGKTARAGRERIRRVAHIVL
jgi:hypothetical protein